MHFEDNSAYLLLLVFFLVKWVLHRFLTSVPLPGLGSHLGLAAQAKGLFAQVGCAVPSADLFL